MLSIILYNLWILTRVEIQSMTSCFFKHIFEIEITVREPDFLSGNLNRLNMRSLV